MADAEDSPKVEIRSTKRARLERLDTPQLDGCSRPAEAAVPVSRQPAMHTEALRSVLKGAHRPVFVSCGLCILVSHTSPTFFCLCLQCLLSRPVSFV